MVNPAYGILPLEWARLPIDKNVQQAVARPQINIPPRQVRFQVEIDSESHVPTNWSVALSLIIGNERISFGMQHVTDSRSQLVFTYSPENNQLTGVAQDRLAQIIPTLASGTLVVFEASVTDSDNGKYLFQTLRFEVRVLGAETTALPLTPRYTMFEDPEYNRRLSSQSAQAERQIVITHAADNDVEVGNIRMAVDRREYHPDSALVFIYEWKPLLQTKENESTNVTTTSAKLQLYRVESGGIATKLRANSITVTRNSLASINLGDYIVNNKLMLSPGDTLLLELDLNKTDMSDDRLKVFLSVQITDQPIIPAPEAGYALLRWQNITGRDEVECVRFAWSPSASRIELIAAQDLLDSMVRRRAVFQWRDSIRPGIARYTIQKIAANGSTFVPEENDWRVVGS